MVTNDFDKDGNKIDVECEKTKRAYIGDEEVWYDIVYGRRRRLKIMKVK